MAIYTVTTVEGLKTVKDASGKVVSASTLVHLYAPTKKGDNWTSYVGKLNLSKDGLVSFTITHLNSSAWGNVAWRTAPFNYERPDVEKFVKKECATTIHDLMNLLAS